MGKQAINFSDNWKTKSIYFLGDETNKHEIVITKKDKSCIRGEQLFYNYKGINIYAELDSIIYIDTKNDIIQIQKHKELTPPDQREYLVLLVYYDESLSNSFPGIIGRQNAFDYIKSMIEEINIEESIILTETVEFKDALNIYEFMKECILNGIVENEDGFDVDEYVISTDIEE